MVLALECVITLTDFLGGKSDRRGRWVSYDRVRTSLTHCFHVIFKKMDCEMAEVEGPAAEDSILKGNGK